MIELFISIILLRTLKGGWCFGLTSSELRFLPKSTILDILLDLFRELFKRSHHFALHGKEASVATSLSVNCTFCLSPPFLFRTSHDADNKDLSSFQLEWTQQHIRTRSASQLYCTMNFIKMTVCIPMNLNKISLNCKCDFILRGTAWTLSQIFSFYCKFTLSLTLKNCRNLS